MMKGRIEGAYSKGPAGEMAKQQRMVLRMYDEALGACVTADPVALNAAIDLLIDKLDYALWPELAMSLREAYQVCRNHCEAGDFHEAGRILATLRKSWEGHQGDKLGQ